MASTDLMYLLYQLSDDAIPVIARMDRNIIERDNLRIIENYFDYKLNGDSLDNIEGGYLFRSDNHRYPDNLNKFNDGDLRRINFARLSAIKAMKDF